MKPIAWYDPTNGAVSTDKDSPLFTPLGQVLPLYTKVEQEPVAWKLMPRDATDAMLKAMDECSTEGYDERLYAGHAASVYMAAWDASDTHPPQRKWVGLTPEDTFEIGERLGLSDIAWVDLMQAIEAALKAKNT